MFGCVLALTSAFIQQCHGQLPEFLFMSQCDVMLCSKGLLVLRIQGKYTYKALQGVEGENSTWEDHILLLGSMKKIRVIFYN